MYILPRSAFRMIVALFIVLLIICAYNISVCTIVLQRSSLEHAMYLSAIDDRQTKLNWKLDDIRRWARSNWKETKEGG